jgi:hypothetical protein
MVKPPDHPETWYSLEQAALMCERDPRTIANLLSRYQLPRQRLWVVRNRVRRRRLRLSPACVAFLQQITIRGVKPHTLMRPAK